MQNFKPKANIILLILWVFSAAACKTSGQKQISLQKPIPVVFADDSADFPLPLWREVFFDPGLRKLIDSALSGNFDLQIAISKIESARAAVRFTRGIRLPELQAVGASGARKFGDYTMDGVGNFDTRYSPNINDKQMIPQNPLPDYYIGFQATWEIDLWGRLKSRRKAAAARFIASQYGKDLIVTSLIAEVAAAYYQLLTFDRELEILKENIALQEAAMEMAKAHKASAKANQLAVEMLHAQLLSTKATEAEVRQLALEYESRLNYLCGTYPQKIERDSAFKEQETVLRTGIPSALLKNRADIRQAEHEILASNADLDAAQKAFYPGLNINPSLGLQSFKALLLFEAPASLAYQVAGGLSAPLLNRRRLKADLMNAAALQKQAYLYYEKTVVNSFMEVYMAMNKINNTRELLRLKQEEVNILKQSVLTSGELFKAGRAGYLEIIMAQKNALQSQIELNEYHKRLHIVQVELYRALGGGWK